jgi:hypothetical protein
MEQYKPAGATRRAVLKSAVPCALALPAIGCAMTDGSIPLSLVSRDWHTEIGVPLHLLDAPTVQGWLSVMPRRDWQRIVLPDGRIGFGFGAKSFMMASSPGVGDAIAALLNAPAVVAVSGMPARLEHEGPIDDYVEVKVTQEGLGRMLGFVRRQVERDAAGRPALVGGGLFRGRSLFDSRLRYSSFFTCNTWTLQALGAAGLPVFTDGVVWSRQVMRQARRVAAAQAAG